MAVKEAVFPFARFPGVDLLLGPEMKSTGEVMGLDRDFAAAFIKSQLGAGTELPASGTVFVSVRDRDKTARSSWRDGCASWASSCRGDARHGRGAARRPGSPSRSVKKVHEGRPHVVDMIKNGDIAMLINTTEGRQAIGDSYTLRRAALMAQAALLHHRCPAPERSCRRWTRFAPVRLKSRRCNRILPASH